MPDVRLDYLTVPGATSTDRQSKGMVDGIEEVWQTTYLTHGVEGDLKILVRRRTGLGTVQLIGTYLPSDVEFARWSFRQDNVEEFDPNALAFSMFRSIDGLKGTIVALDCEVTYVKIIPQDP